ncbi:MAG TPA: hypothetical protein IAC89_00330 [Candidatus Aphodousia faecalis]|nr:hypothetical protein [Candidatus Aphodousia faecalis]
MKAKEMTPQDYEQQARSMRRFLGTTWGFGGISTTGSSKNIPQSTSQSLSSQAVASTGPGAGGKTTTQKFTETSPNPSETTSIGTGLKTSGRSMGEESARRWLPEQLDPLARLTEEQIKEAEEMGLL